MTSVRAFAATPAARRAARESLAEPDEHWNLLMVCVAVYVLAAVGRVHQLFPAVAVVRPTLMAAGLALVCVALDHAAMARLRATLRLPALKWLIAMVVWAGFTIPLALWPGGAFDVFVNGLVKPLAMVLAVVTAVRGSRDVRRLAATLFLATSIFAVFVYTQFEVDMATQRYGKLVYYDANEFAILAVATMPFGAYALWRTTSNVLRIAIVSLLTVTFLVFVGTGSRGGMVALGVALIFALLGLNAIKLRWRVLGFAVIALGFVFTASDQFWNRMDSVVEKEDDYNITSPTGRLKVWKRGIGYMLDRPVFGVGAGNFATAEGTISDYAAELRQRAVGVKWSAAHNSYVQVGAELGVPGLLFFGGAFVTAMLGLRRVARTAERDGRPDRDLRVLAQAGLTGLIGFATGAIFLSLAYSDLLFALLAAAICTYAVALRTKAIAPRHGPRPA